jgi:predicted transposase YdaD
MEMTWAERMEEKYTQKGIEQGIEALRRVVLRLLSRRFGSVPETVRRRVEGIEAMEPLENLAERALEAQSIEDLGLS